MYQQLFAVLDHSSIEPQFPEVSLFENSEWIWVTILLRFTSSYSSSLVISDIYLIVYKMVMILDHAELFISKDLPFLQVKSVWVLM